jgi:hypothetical protein
MKSITEQIEESQLNRDTLLGIMAAEIFTKVVGTQGADPVSAPVFAVRKAEAIFYEVQEQENKRAQEQAQPAVEAGVMAKPARIVDSARIHMLARQAAIIYAAWPIRDTWSMRNADDGDFKQAIAWAYDLVKVFENE